MILSSSKATYDILEKMRISKYAYDTMTLDDGTTVPVVINGLLQPTPNRSYFRVNQAKSDGGASTTDVLDAVEFLNGMVTLIGCKDSRDCKDGLEVSLYEKVDAMKRMVDSVGNDVMEAAQSIKAVEADGKVVKQRLGAVEQKVDAGVTTASISAAGGITTSNLPNADFCTSLTTANKCNAFAGLCTWTAWSGKTIVGATPACVASPSEEVCKVITDNASPNLFCNTAKCGFNSTLFPKCFVPDYQHCEHIIPATSTSCAIGGCSTLDIVGICKL